MRLNNKGFAISTIMYLILILGVVLITSILLILSSRKIVLDKQKDEVLNSIYKICTPVKVATKADSNVPTGDFLRGDEYVCEVFPGRKYTFFVIGKDESETEINLIMEENIYEYNSVPWVSNEDYGETGKTDKGPITAMNYLHNLTKSWSNIPNMVEYHYYNEDFSNIDYAIEIENNVGTINYNSGNIVGLTMHNLKARLITTSWLYDGDDEFDRCPNKICPDWLSSSEGYGYWTLSSSSESTAWCVYGSEVIEKPLNTENIGIRPVITVPIEYFSE